MTDSHASAGSSHAAPGDRLPDFPWDALAPYRATAAAHADGVVDLSVGTPVDPVPESAQTALTQASDSPGYPTTLGIPELRQAAAAWLQRATGAQLDPDTEIIPTIGSKEIVASLPTVLGVRPGSAVGIPAVAYPTYAVGALLAGARPVPNQSLLSFGPERPSLFWLNSPSNPTGAVLGVDHLRKVVAWARERGTIVVSDECYLTLGWDEEPISLLDPRVTGGDLSGLLAVHSLSKRSNFAGYRLGILSGDRSLVQSVLAVRKHAGMLVPTPVQWAGVAAFNDDVAAAEQKARYARRRTALWSAVTNAGFTIEHSVAGLYLWATRGESCWDTVAWFAERGIVVTPGDFYGTAGAQHVRIALTATDERVAAAVARLA
jgi:succinyldiaminopimelate transaminase